MNLLVKTDELKGVQKMKDKKDIIREERNSS